MRSQGHPDGAGRAAVTQFSVSPQLQANGLNSLVDQPSRKGTQMSQIHQPAEQPDQDPAAWFGGWKTHLDWANHDFEPTAEHPDHHDAAMPEDLARLGVRGVDTSQIVTGPTAATFTQRTGCTVIPVQETDQHRAETAETYAAVVRPFIRARGRSAIMSDLRLESLVSAVAGQEWLTGGQRSFDDVRIVRVCRTPQSVAEISAQMQISWNICRILVTDAAARGLLVVHLTQLTVAGRPPLELLQRLYRGLQEWAVPA